MRLIICFAVSLFSFVASGSAAMAEEPSLMENGVTASEASGASTDAADDGGLFSFADYGNALLSSHPSVEQVKFAIGAMAEIPEYVNTLENPSFGLAVQNLPYDPLSFTSENMTKKSISLSQRFPAPGILDARKRVAEKNLLAMEALLPEQRMELIEKSALLFLRQKHLQYASELAAKNVAILASFLEVAMAKYSVGTGMQQDVLWAETELTKMKVVKLEFAEQAERLRLRLLVMASLPLSLSFKNMQVIDLPPTEGSLENQYAKAVSDRPLIHSLIMRVESYSEQVELARKSLMPDYGISIAYGQRDDAPATRRDFISAGITFSLPVRASSRERRKIAEKEMRRQEASSKLAMEKLRLKGELASLQEEEIKKQEQLKLYDEGLLLQAEQTVFSTLSAYRVNKTDFLSLVTSQTTLLSLEIRRSALWVGLQSARLKIRREVASNSLEIIDGK